MTWTKASLVLALISLAFGQNSDLTESDIRLTPEQQATLEVTSNPADPFSPQNAVVRSERSLWPNGIIHYTLDGLNTQARNAITAAMNDYTSMTCIRFVERTSEPDYVRFFTGSGCYSYIGRISGPQDISIGNGCEHKGIVIHEIFHALGRWHEQSRPDRDMFVRIFPDNIRGGTESNFDITNPNFVTTQGVEYDLDSIMHYGSRAFSRNGLATILPVDSSIMASRLGQRQGLSTKDLQHVMTLYCPDDQSSASWSNWGTWSGCSRTCNGGSRSRMRTCQGGTTCEGSNIQTQQCNTANCPVPPTWGQWSSYGTCSQTCGSGRQSRSRMCNGGNNCVGTMTQFRDCRTQACPEPATWGSWGSWSSCSRTCQGGSRQRSRRCQNGNTCPGSSVDSSDCNENIPCETQPSSGEWTTWGTCTVKCGGGKRYRTRMCGLTSCNSQSQSCNTQDCNPEPELLGKIDRGCWYLNINAGRIGSLEGLTSYLMDNPQTRKDPVRKCGISAQTFNKRFFGLSLGYCLVSLNDSLADFQYFRSNLCRDGNGVYSNGWFVMRVYEISNEQLFSDSAALAENANSTVQTTTPSSGYKLTYSIVTVILTLLLVITIL